MSSSYCIAPSPDPHRDNSSYKRVLWAVLAINAGMFVVEIAAGMAAGSASLQADALDFLGDAGNYVISLAVASMALRYRAVAAFAKGLTMGAFGLWVVATVIWHAILGTVPEPVTMGVVGVAALVANAACAVLLYAYRAGDANMQSVWICSRNDAMGNLAVLLTALGVFGTGTGWPDLIVAVIMAMLALQGAWIVVRQARQELHSPQAQFAAADRHHPVARIGHTSVQRCGGRTKPTRGYRAGSEWQTAQGIFRFGCNCRPSKRRTHRAP